MQVELEHSSTLGSIFGQQLRCRVNHSTCVVKAEVEWAAAEAEAAGVVTWNGATGDLFFVAVFLARGHPLTDCICLL